ncbi:DUF5694 domain-containing protein [Kangiella koreensis]|uniref:Uncharacterized protein n=1 Tax=Kangiella koreensis (strain DSM 16069 / JCM 12317 / KCTC 12182 / SW-125) TaxID=523791 RepID=C7RAY5_KANKD|nr:DUF5694 domain-containing protein [Kangiella koreensis]ACV26427.1 conserved hypothetical protein [Kangiella koreensis DSM 16069]
MSRFVYIFGVFFLVLFGCASHQSVGGNNQIKENHADSNVVQVMVIGSEHFASPGLDVINIEPIDVLTPQRQQELQAIAESLRQFEPTVVAVERVTKAPYYIDNGFVAFKESDLLSKRNETIQLGYRLAKLAGLKQVHGIDEQPSEGEPDYFPMQKLIEQINRQSRMAEFQSMIGDVTERLNSFTKDNLHRDLAEYLALANTPGSPLIDDDMYFDLMKFDQGESQPGAELFALYMMRNTKIISKLINVTKPGDRVVIIYGAGHKPWFEYILNGLTDYELVDPVPYLEKASQSIKQ